ncbi:MAG: DUF1501 domain-containing protein [Planctomycetales bacterium]|nr:DUF1501 domain-containing protein [Planctomycetales bacterium]
MLSIQGARVRHCDGVSRREALRIGGAGALAALTLPALLRAEQRGTAKRHSIINLHLDGGPPQMDMIDPKPDAPVEVRGEFRSIATQTPGLRLCELMPKLAAMSDRFAFIRSLVGSAGRHDGFQCQSGFDTKSLAALGGRPALGCVIAKLMGSPKDPAPPFVDMMQGRPLVRNSARPGFLGPAYQPFRPDISEMFSRPLEEGMKAELARLGEQHATSLALNAELTLDRLEDRADLLRRFDGLRREIDAHGMMEAVDQFHEQAAAILTSGTLARALDVNAIPPAELQRYTAPLTGTAPSSTAEDHHSMRKLLLARRLIEAGARVVSVSFSDFDTHSSNFTRLRHLLPILDHGLCTLVSDLEERGMLDDVTIVAWGEFGRTPKINTKGGRDHWPRVSPAIVAGGGLRTGQVIGATDRTASTVESRPVHYQDVIATLYHQLGIVPDRTTVPDTTGRPQYLVVEGKVIPELVY